MARKLLSLVVALAVVLSSMSFAFAADPKAVSADVKDAKVKAAVEKLVALNMVEGIDGKYVPDQKLKRSELTKLIVIALGLGPAADAAKGATQFSDVDASHWASGYISVAAGQGIVQGMGDGTFAPDAEVTFAQGLTMLVRALGYKDEFLPGTWPGNYLAKASEKDIYEGLTIVPGSAITRGNFAIMMSNTLDAKVIKVDTYDGSSIKYAESEKTLAKDKLKLDKAEVRLTGNARLTKLKADEVSGIWTKSSKDTEIKGAGDADAAFDSLLVASGINPDLYMGSTCDIYVKDKDTIVYIAETGLSQVYWDGVDKFTGTTTVKIDGVDTSILPDIKLRWSGKTLTVKGGDKSWTSDAATVYVTKAEETNQWKAAYVGTDTSSKAYVLGQDYGRFVVENGKVVFADLYRYDKIGYMVKSVDAEKNTITYIDVSGSENTLNISSVYTGGAKFYKDGAEITIKDLKPLDLLYISNSKIDSKNIANVFVFTKAVTGTLSGIKVEGTTPKSIDLDSKGFTDIGDNLTWSKDNNETYKGDKSAVTQDILNDFYGMKVTTLIDNNKKIRHVFGEAVTSSEMFGIVTKAMTESEQIKVYTSNDDTVTYAFEDTAKVYDTTVATNGAKVNFSDLSGALGGDLGANDKYMVIRFKLNKDGKVAKNSVSTFDVDRLGAAPATATNLQVTGSFGTNTLNLGGTTYYATSDIKIFDLQSGTIGATSVDTTDLNVSKWDNFSNKVVDNTTGYVYVVTDTTNTKDVKAMFIMKGMDAVTLDQKAAYLINTSYVDGKKYGNFKVYGVDGVKSYEITNTMPSNITNGVEAAVIINLASSGKVEVYTGAGTTVSSDVYANGKSNKMDFATVAGRVYKVDGNRLVVGDSAATKYEVASDAVVYEKDAVKSFSDIDIDDMVVAVMKNGVIQSVELLNAKTTKNVTYGTAASMGYVKYDFKAIVDVSDGYYTSATPSGAVGVVGDVDGKLTGVMIP